MESTFSDLFRLLMKHDVKFIVVGGVACGLNGFIRATEDVDIIVDTCADNIEKLLHALKFWGDGYVRELEPSDFAIAPGAVRLVEFFPLDIFTQLAEKTYHEFLPNAQQHHSGILYLNPTDLILTKRRSHREKDRIDILALKRIGDSNS